MSTDPLRAYAADLHCRAGFAPDPMSVAAVAAIVPLIEADVRAMLAAQLAEAADWHTAAPGFIQGCIVLLDAGAHRGRASRQPCSDAEDANG